MEVAGEDSHLLSSMGNGLDTMAGCNYYRVVAVMDAYFIDKSAVKVQAESLEPIVIDLSRPFAFYLSYPFSHDHPLAGCHPHQMTDCRSPQKTNAFSSCASCSS